MALTNRDLYNHIKEKNLRIQKSTVLKTFIYNFLISHVENVDEDLQNDIRSKANIFVVHLYDRWQAPHRDKNDFFRLNANWLKSPFNMPVATQRNPPNTPMVPPSSSKSGRKSKSFEGSSERSQRRIISTKDSNILRGPIPKSPTFMKELEETTFDEQLIAAAERSIIDIFLIDASKDEKLTVKEFLRKSYNLAAELQALGCDTKTVVGIISENRLEYPIVVLGTMLTGAILACYNPAYTTEELKYVYNITKPTIVFCSQKNYGNMAQIAPSSSRIIVFDDPIKPSNVPCLKFSQLSQSTKVYIKVKDRRSDDVIFVLHSSGTTGLPKGVMLTHKNLTFILKILIDAVPSRGSMSVSIGPMYHSYGLHNLLSTIARNQTLIIMPKYDDRLYLKTIQKYKIKQLALVPTLVTYLLKDPKVNEYDLSSVEAVTCGSAPLKYETERAFKEKFRLQYVQQGYGLTESTLITTIKNLTSSKPGTVGSVIPGAQIKVVDIRTGRILGKNEVGEIYIKGPHVMKGYFGNAKATAETLDEEGWLHSGDVGYYDDDGEFFIVDRAKELIKYKGFQVAPAELEALLLTHPAVVDCGVIGIPDEVAGELPRAYVVKRPGVKVTEEDLIQYVAGKLSPQKKLRGGVEFVSEIPKNLTGKILRRKLRELWTVKRKSKL